MSVWIGKNLHSLPKGANFTTHWVANLWIYRYYNLLHGVRQPRRDGAQPETLEEEIARLEKYINNTCVRMHGRWVTVRKLYTAMDSRLGPI
jgi:hypothetical protein